MRTDAANAFVGGAGAVACVVITLFFLRFWRQTGDRLFAFFALAFAVFAINLSISSFLDEANAARPYVYLLRLAAFALIIVAIVEKNRSRRPRGLQER